MFRAIEGDKMIEARKEDDDDDGEEEKRSEAKRYKNKNERRKNIKKKRNENSRILKFQKTCFYLTRLFDRMLRFADIFLL